MFLDFWKSMDFLKKSRGCYVRDVSKRNLFDPCSIDFFKKSMKIDLSIFNTKVLKIYDFRFS